MSKKSKRSYLDDISANKPARSSKPASKAKGSLKSHPQRQPENEFSEFRRSQSKQTERSPNHPTADQPIKPRVTKAKKLNSAPIS